ncbi:hypothetical protein N7468_003240 [Penicillium chermesinum]|uniref:Uncharacterized protein n=1 Tax=Penicillium chermesinum TaxID=63820 RepID=A0A9W9P634_9EURO|nr:uncharacterized protein N7468_003240 [Penicillium chermesinum]KAJ5238621.1 hypothetical protein N7468_003240 [Penicillium chermesinum]
MAGVLMRLGEHRMQDKDSREPDNDFMEPTKGPSAGPLGAQDRVEFELSAESHVCAYNWQCGHRPTADIVYALHEELQVHPLSPMFRPIPSFEVLEKHQ